MCSENLDKRDFQRRNLAMEEDASQIQLDLETNIHVRPVYRISKRIANWLEVGLPVDSRRPPESEATIRDLVKTGSLCVCEFFEFH
jgi:hypothetical protein